MPLAVIFLHVGRQVGTIFQRDGRYEWARANSPSGSDSVVEQLDNERTFAFDTGDREVFGYRGFVDRVGPVFRRNPPAPRTNTH